jgi:ankyrin repeat protein
LRQVADAARNNNFAAMSAMLRHGFPVTALSQHGATPLHWAAFHGNPDMLEDILKYDPQSTRRIANSKELRWAG